MKATSIPVGEYESLPFDIKEITGVFAKGGNLKKFLVSRQADGAFVRVIYTFTNTYMIDDFRQMIDECARNEGTTWAVMRAACGLGKVLAPPNAVCGLFKERR